MGTIGDGVDVYRPEFAEIANKHIPTEGSLVKRTFPGNVYILFGVVRHIDRLPTFGEDSQYKKQGFDWFING